ncbi:Oidioi.mRNA.OKI2018_I69.PAR.g10636.t1.cds [Oikopleura dioica]|uniref:Oidioi.mRNA.OKI2018_I69.PAR.g10636.t1.cds n=1 Tax=Oikopleura dioica TaxID=34765 RepID=A0ABN7RZ14_OIKDI|nr:Oidioi.mRNA.OKI2018_I69.PAR.g10636.t1.cds [Oikopleura dioica]
MATKQQEKNASKNETRQRKGKKSKKEAPKVEEKNDSKKVDEKEDDVMLEQLCAKMIKNGKLKYTKDRKGNLVLIQQNEGLTMQDFKVFGFLAIIAIYVFFFYDHTHKITVNYYYESFRAYIRRFSDRLMHQVDIMVSGPEL